MRMQWLMAAVFVAIMLGCAKPDPTLSTDEIGTLPRVTVLWISVDGLRHDYVDRAKPPFLLKLQHEGAYSTALLPAFPSLTFSSHSSEATGVGAEKHGITGNSFYDRRREEHFYFPQDDLLLQAEPIWRTAPRQGVRTAVFDWPFSQWQHGHHPADYSSRGPYDSKLTDTDRLARIVRTYQRDDAGTRPLRLLMAYIEGTDAPGHLYGPDSAQVDQALLSADRAIAAAVAGVQEHFEKIRHPGEQLCVLITTDHGMARVHTLVNPAELLADPDAVLEASGPVANVFLPNNPSPARIAETAARVEAAAQNIPGNPDAVKVYRKDTLPKEWAYAHPTRTGDLVLVAAEGYTFSGRIDGVVADTRAVGGPLGMHGYPVETSEACRGYMLFWRAGENLGGKNLGEVPAIRLHATVAKLLNIQPAPSAAEPALPLP